MLSGLSGGRGSIAVLLALVSLCCGPSQAEVNHRRALQEWARHEDTLERLAARQSVSIGDFEGAVRFFVPLTGIEIPATHGAIVDIYPTAQTPEALPELWKWYTENEKKLYWDERSQCVRLRPEPTVSRFIKWLSSSTVLQ
jgi:hypothetical protein